MDRAEQKPGMHPDGSFRLKICRLSNIWGHEYPFPKQNIELSLHYYSKYRQEREEKLNVENRICG